MDGDSFAPDDLDVLERVLDMFPYAPVVAFFGVQVQRCIEDGSLTLPIEGPEEFERLFGDDRHLTFRGHRYTSEDAGKYIPREAFPLITIEQVLAIARVALARAEQDQLRILAERQMETPSADQGLDISYSVAAGRAGSVWTPSSRTTQDKAGL